MGLTRAALSRPIFIFMLMAAAFLLGFISYSSMRKELNPEVSFGVVTISTAYPGAGPEDINNLISRKVEEAVSSANGLREVTSTSHEGISSVTATFELSTNIDAALNDVRSKVDAIQNQLPKDANKPQVSKFDNSAQPVLTLSVTSPTLTSKALRDIVDDKLIDRFGQIDGVASATVSGGDVREIQVQVRKDSLLAYGIGINDVQQAVQNATQNQSSGKLLSGRQEISVRVLGEFPDVAAIQNMSFTVKDPKNPNNKAASVRLSDVATIVDSAVERTQYSRVNGKDSIVISIQKTREGNAVDISAKASQTIKDIETEYKDQGITFTKTFEQAVQITDSLSDLQFALMFGIFLVAIIVYTFLHNFRGMLIVCLAIPTSIFATFIAIKGMGFTINNMSMLSLSLAIGVLVDDAIVVLENIYRHLKMGEDPRDAALNGRSEIGLAALAITFADVVVFLPIAFMGGIVGQFFKPMALGFVAATLFSLFVSFTLTPLLASRWYRKGEDMEHPVGWFAVGFERGFGRIVETYRRGLEWALNHRWFVFILGNAGLVAVFMFIGGSFVPAKAGVAAAFKAGQGPMMFAIILGVITTIVNAFRKRFSLKYIVSGVLFGLIFPVAAVAGQAYATWKGEAVFKFGFLPDSDGGLVTINVQLPPDANLASTQKVVSQIEEDVKSDPDVKYVVSNVGTQGAGNFGGSTAGSNYAQVNVTLFDKMAFTDRFKHITTHLRSRSSNSVAADMQQKIGRIPGAFITVAASSGFGFGSAIQLGFESDDLALLVKTATNVKNRLNAGEIKGVVNADLSSKPGKPELQAIPDRTLLADSSTSMADVANALRTLYQGNDDAKLRQHGREYPIRVMMDLRDRDNPDLVNQVPLKFVNGTPVLLGQVAKFNVSPALTKIDRRDRREEIRVNADLLPGYAAGSVQAQIDKWIVDNKLVPQGVHLKPLGQADAQARESQFMILAFFLGLILVYMLLASLFDNLLYPLIIQMAQPQAMVGALLALMLTDKGFNLVGFIGLVTLTGLVGKNAILVVDYTNTLRSRGRNRHDALVEAAPTRLRPIAMTTLALILGMLPVALAIGRGSEFRETIGITIIGGITLSTLLTLFVIPCSYTIFDDMSNGITGGLVWFRGLFGFKSDPEVRHGIPVEDEPAPAGHR